MPAPEATSSRSGRQSRTDEGPSVGRAGTPRTAGTAAGCTGVVAPPPPVAGTVTGR